MPRWRSVAGWCRSATCAVTTALPGPEGGRGQWRDRRAADHALHAPQSQRAGDYTKDMAITDTAVHDIDIVRWMFGEEIVGTTVLFPRKSKNGGDLQDPLLLLLEMRAAP